VKKYIIGLLCGVVLSMTTAAFAANSIQAILFPSKITFHVNNTSKVIDGAGVNPILNYNNKTYIPLRAFADAMGANVTYENSNAGKGSIPNIEIFSAANYELSLKHYDAVNEMCTPLNIALEPPSEYYEEKTFGELSLSSVNLFQFNLTNISKENMTLKSLDDLQFEVYKMNAQNQPEKLVYSYKLPVISGWIPTQTGYNVTISWNQRGSDGYLITAGNYLVKLKKPDSISYQIEGSVDMKSTLASQGMGCNRNKFGVQFK
jgi:hypothetical protein